MSKCPGAGHCRDCGNGGGALLVGVVLVVIIVALARPVGRAVGHAADQAARFFGELLMVLAYALASVVAMAALAGVSWGVYRLWRWQGRRRVTRPAELVPPVVGYVLRSPSAASIEAPKERAATIHHVVPGYVEVTRRDEL